MADGEKKYQRLGRNVEVSQAYKMDLMECESRLILRNGWMECGSESQTL
jgi:hypothetical protein